MLIVTYNLPYVSYLIFTTKYIYSCQVVYA
jgi:hypothetical protein